MAQTLPNGVVIPNADGGEQISATGVQEMRALGVSADAAIAAARFTKGTPAPFDFDQMKEPGTYSLGDPFPAGYTNVPEGITTASVLNVYGSPVQSWCAQEIYQYGFTPKRLWRISRTTGTWNPWVQIGGGGDVSSAMGGNAARQSHFVSTTGGPVSTGGKAAFALRLDHGWTNIKSKLRTELSARGIVPGVASCSRQWDLEENSGATIAEVKSWVANGEFEILNQGATHGQSMVNYVDEIVNGRVELEDQLDTNVWGFAPPGESTAWEDFDGGRVDGWASLPAAIALASHAYSMGYVGGARRVLDGTIRQGLAHITLDTYDMAQARAQVDAAISEGRGIQVMLHPRELDKAGKITTSAFLDFLDYVVEKRDAGDLVILSPGELVRADATPPPTVSDVDGLQDALDGKSAVGHTHDDRYYTEAETDVLLAGKVDTIDPRLAGTWDDPVDLGTAHLDTITTPGFYTQIFASRATTANGYPHEGAAGILEVKTWNKANGYVIQTFTPWQSNAMAKRTKYASGFQTWYGVNGFPLGATFATTAQLDALAARVTALENA